MAGSSLFLNAARAAKVAALLVFLLPFVTVSCSTREMAAAMSSQSGGSAEAPPAGMPDSCVLVQASGLQLALGQASPGSCTGAFGNMPSDSSHQPDMTGPFAQNDYAVIGAAAVLILSLLLGFVLRGGARAGLGIVASLAAIGAVAWSVFMRIPDAVFGSPPPAGAGPALSAEQTRQVIHVSPGIGFWLMALALVAAIVCYVLAMKKGEAPAQAPPAT
jgi:hypothetical protein